MQPESRIRKQATFTVEVAGTFVTRVLTIALGLVASIILARALGPDGRGAVAALVLYPTLLLTFFEGGFRQATIHALGKGISEERSVVGAVLVHFLIAAILSFIAIGALLGSASDASWGIGQILLASAIVPTGLASALIRGLLLGKQEILLANLIVRRARYAYIMLLVLLWLLDYLTISTAVAVTVLGQLAGIGVGLTRLRQIGTEFPHWSVKVWWMLARRGAVYAAALFVIDMNYRVGMIVLEQRNALSALGEFTIATQLAEVLWQLPSAFGFVIFAKAAAASPESEEAVQKTVARATRISVALVTVGATILAVLSNWLVPLIFGIGFESASQVTRALLPGVVAFTTYKVINMYFAGTGSPRTALYLMLPVVVLNYLLAGLFYQSLGVLGIAYAATISYIIGALAFVIAFTKQSGIPLYSLLVLQPTDIKEFMHTLQTQITRLGRPRS